MTYYGRRPQIINKYFYGGSQPYGCFRPWGLGARRYPRCAGHRSPGPPADSPHADALCADAGRAARFAPAAAFASPKTTVSEQRRREPARCPRRRAPRHWEPPVVMTVDQAPPPLAHAAATGFPPDAGAPSPAAPAAPSGNSARPGAAAAGETPAAVVPQVLRLRGDSRHMVRFTAASATACRGSPGYTRRSASRFVAATAAATAHTPQ